VIEIKFDSDVDLFLPGDFLICEYFVKNFEASKISAIETSVIWLTEGKGEEDIGVHYFERRLHRSLASDTFKHTQRLSTVLPASPLSYEGEILKIRWCVRVRLYLDEGQQITEDKYFRLGNVQPFEKLTPEPDEIDGDSADR
jgi:hypothetical protein